MTIKITIPICRSTVNRATRAMSALNNFLQYVYPLVAIVSFAVLMHAFLVHNDFEFMISAVLFSGSIAMVGRSLIDNTLPYEFHLKECDKK